MFLQLRFRETNEPFLMNVQAINKVGKGDGFGIIEMDNDKTVETVETLEVITGMLECMGCDIICEDSGEVEPLTPVREDIDDDNAGRFA